MTPFPILDEWFGQLDANGLPSNAKMARWWTKSPEFDEYLRVHFGPFVKHGSTYASIKAPDSPYTIELPRALQLIEEKEEQIRNRIILSFDDGAIEVLNGKYGPYITNGERNGKIPKDRDPKTLTREECVALLEAGKPVKKKAGRFGRAAKKAAPAKKAAVKKAVPVKAAAAKKAPAKKAAAKKAVKKAPAKKKAAVKKATKKAA